MNHRSKLLSLGLLFLVAGLALLAVLLVSCTPFGDYALGANPPPSPAAYDAEPSGITTFNNLSAADLTLSDDLTVGDDTTLSGITVLDDTALTVTDGYTLTATASAYHLDSAGAVTVTLAACSNNGQLLVLFGDDNNTITVADANIRTTTGSALTIGQYDLALFACFDTEWIELALAADS